MKGKIYVERTGRIRSYGMLCLIYW